MKISDGPQTFCLFIIDHVPFLSVVNLILSMQTVTIAYRGNQQVLCEPSFHIGGRIQSLFSTDLKFHFSKVKCHQWSRRWCYNIDDVLTIPNVSYRVWTGAAAYALWYIMYHNIISKSYTEIPSAWLKNIPIFPNLECMAYIKLIVYSPFPISHLQSKYMRMHILYKVYAIS